MLRMEVVGIISAMHTAVTVLQLLGVREVGGTLLAPRSFSSGGRAAWGAAVLARERQGRAGQGNYYPGRVPQLSRRAEQARRAGRVVFNWFQFIVKDFWSLEEDFQCCMGGRQWGNTPFCW
jgi:hypothetical protein